MYIEAFTTHFGELSDTRQSAKVTYPLEDILFITCVVSSLDPKAGARSGIMPTATLTGFNSMVTCAMASPLMTPLPAPFRVSTRSSFRASFINWMQAVHESTEAIDCD